MAYVLQVEALERHSVAISAALVSAGAKEALEVVGERRAAFDDWLVSDPGVTVDSKLYELRRELGVA